MKGPFLVQKSRGCWGVLPPQEKKRIRTLLVFRTKDLDLNGVTYSCRLDYKQPQECSNHLNFDTISDVLIYTFNSSSWLWTSMLALFGFFSCLFWLALWNLADNLWLGIILIWEMDRLRVFLGFPWKGPKKKIKPKWHF